MAKKFDLVLNSKNLSTFAVFQETNQVEKKYANEKDKVAKKNWFQFQLPVLKNYLQ